MGIKWYTIKDGFSRIAGIPGVTNHHESHHYGKIETDVCVTVGSPAETKILELGGKDISETVGTQKETKFN